MRTLRTQLYRPFMTYESGFQKIAWETMKNYDLVKVNHTQDFFNKANIQFIELFCLIAIPTIYSSFKSISYVKHEILTDSIKYLGWL